MTPGTIQIWRVQIWFGGVNANLRWPLTRGEFLANPAGGGYCRTNENPARRRYPSGFAVKRFWPRLGLFCALMPGFLIVGLLLVCVRLGIHPYSDIPFNRAFEVLFLCGFAGSMIFPLLSRQSWSERLNELATCLVVFAGNFIFFSVLLFVLFGKPD